MPYCSLEKVRRESAQSFEMSGCMIAISIKALDLKSVVVSVHHNRASDLIKVYQVAGGLICYLVFSGAHTWGIRDLFLKIWEWIKLVKSEDSTTDSARFGMDSLLAGNRCLSHLAGRLLWGNKSNNSIPPNKWRDRYDQRKPSLKRKALE